VSEGDRADERKREREKDKDRKKERGREREKKRENGNLCDPLIFAAGGRFNRVDKTYN
jgi:hypothetical protein